MFCIIMFILISVGVGLISVSMGFLCVMECKGVSVFFYKFIV